MDAETLARCSAWPAFLCYAAGVALLISAVRRRRSLLCGVWTIGWVTVIVHVWLSLWLVHGGSWAAAYEHTAQRTRAAVGWNSGAGVWFNLMAIVAWGFLVVMLWSPPRHADRFKWLQGLCHLFLAFMIFNATVVFGSAVAQLAGGLICVSIAVLALVTRLRGKPGDSASEA